MAGHEVPTRLLVVEELPRNAMGKLAKSAVAALFQNGNDA
jgi:acyl-coenzyme A synthetase/AMP-(fatty) acid ligase